MAITWVRVIGDATLPEFMVRLLLGLAVIGITAALAAGMFRRSCADMRHRIWLLSVLAALIAAALLPLIPPKRVGPASERGGMMTAGATMVATAAPDPSFVPRDHPDIPRAAPVATNLVEREAGKPAPVTPTRVIRNDNVRAAGASAPVSFVSALSLQTWLIAAWCAGMIWLLLRLITSAFRASQLVRSATPCEAAALNCLSRVSARLGIARRPRLLQTDQCGTPLCAGWPTHSILLPAGWHLWAPDQLEAVIAHELAHVRRHDVLWQFLASFACAIYWFNPFIWLAAWRMRVERELACDDYVLAGGASATRYARWLLEIAQSMAARRSSSLAVTVAMARRPDLDRRIAAVLDSKRNRGAVSRAGAIALCTFGIALLAPMLVFSPLPATAQAQRAQPAPALPAVKPEVMQLTNDGEAFQITGGVEEENGQPAAGILVNVHLAGERTSTRTGPDGRYTATLHKIRTIDRYELRATTADGLRQTFYRMSTTDPSIKATDPVRLALHAAREFAVTVNDENAKPVAGAYVMMDSEFMVAGEAMTDQAGKALLRVPADAAPRLALAIKPMVGMDYLAFWRKGQAAVDPFRLASDYAGPLNFVLNGAIDVTVHVTDENGAAVAGARVYPWVLNKPRKGSDANIGGLPGFLDVTDTTGHVHFPVIPADNIGAITFRAIKPGFSAPERWMFDPKAGKTTVDAKMERQILVSGTVTDSAGNPAAGALVMIGGANNSIDSFRSELKTAADGSFALNVDPEQLYYFVVFKDHDAAPAETRMIHRDAGGPIKLALRSGIRVHGQVTVGPDNKPAAQAGITMIQEDDETYRKLPPNERFAGQAPPIVRSVTPEIARHMQTDDKGNFEYYAGPGRGRVTATLPSANGALPKRVDLKGNESDFEVKLHLDVMMTRTVKGRVVRQDNPQIAVPEAIVSHGSFSPIRPEFIADRQGNFAIQQRGNTDFYLGASSADNSLRGFVLVKAGDDNVTIPLAPTASAHGRLKDFDGTILADRTINYSIQSRAQEQPLLAGFGGTATTAADGSFTLTGMLPGREYSVRVEERSGASSFPSLLRAGPPITAAAAGQVELGDLTLSAPPIAPNLLRNPAASQPILRERI